MKKLSTIIKLNELKPVDSALEWKENISLFSKNVVIIDARSRQCYYDEHWGPLSIKCAFGGRENYFSRDFCMTVDDKNFLIFNEGRVYGSFIDSADEVESFTIHFAPDFAEQYFQSILSNGQELIDNPFKLDKRQIFFSERLRNHDNEVSPILFEIRRLAARMDFLSIGRIDELNFMLLQKLTKEQIHVDGSSNEIMAMRASTRDELKRRLFTGRNYIFDRYKTDISVDEISNAACLNKFYFIRQFKRAYSATPHQFILRLRLQEAAEHLKKHEKTVTEICDDVGFGDLPSFCNTFKRYYKFSPKEYRSIFLGLDKACL